MEWIIEGAGRAKYCFKLVKVNRILPNPNLIAIKIPDVCRSVSAQFINDDLIALFELALEDGMVKVVEEKHYRLVPASKISEKELLSYSQRSQNSKL